LDVGHDEKLPNRKIDTMGSMLHKANGVSRSFFPVGVGTAVADGPLPDRYGARVREVPEQLAVHLDASPLRGPQEQDDPLGIAGRLDEKSEGALHKNGRWTSFRAGGSRQMLQ
jgi:hypothetical protein